MVRRLLRLRVGLRRVSRSGLASLAAIAWWLRGPRKVGSGVVSLPGTTPNAAVSRSTDSRTRY